MDIAETDWTAILALVISLFTIIGYGLGATEKPSGNRPKLRILCLAIWSLLLVLAVWMSLFSPRDARLVLELAIMLALLAIGWIAGTHERRIDRWASELSPETNRIWSTAAKLWRRRGAIMLFMLVSGASGLGADPATRSVSLVGICAVSIPIASLLICARFSYEGGMWKRGEACGVPVCWRLAGYLPTVALGAPLTIAYIINPEFPASFRWVHWIKPDQVLLSVLLLTVGISFALFAAAWRRSSTDKSGLADEATEKAKWHQEFAVLVILTSLATIPGALSLPWTPALLCTLLIPLLVTDLRIPQQATVGIQDERKSRVKVVPHRVEQSFGGRPSPESPSPGVAGALGGSSDA